MTLFCSCAVGLIMFACDNFIDIIIITYSQLSIIHETEIRVILTSKMVEMVKINFDFKLQKSHGRNDL